MKRLPTAIAEIPVACVDWLFGKRWPRHPIDTKLGIETSNRVPRWLLSSGNAADNNSVGYVGAQPSIIRSALHSIGVTADTIFVDLGSGKGRALVVAAEFPFQSLIGYELSPSMIGVSRKNINTLGLSHRVTVVQSDASQPTLPKTGEIVIFLYNPFKRDLTGKLVSYLTRHLADCSSQCKIWIIYYNPVHYDFFDTCIYLRRYAAKRLLFQDDEKLAAPTGNDFDSIVIYQSPPFRPALANAESQVKITIPDYGADVVPV